MDAALDPINVSALNQYTYCPRRCGLIYLEGEFADNVHTQRGNAEHEQVDRVTHVSRHDGARVEYALPIWSDSLGLIGKCDVVEFWPDGTVYPVEYKHGRRRAWLNDDLQLVAQAICLEEMLHASVRHGAIFHSSSRRRREIEVTDSLRREVEATVAAIRTMLASKQLPHPTAETRRCGECSLRDICQPAAARALKDTPAARDALFEPEPL